MDADPHPKRRIELGGHRVVERIKSHEHQSRGGQCLAGGLRIRLAGGLRIRRLEPEDRYHAVADELIDVSSGSLDGLTHLLKVPVQDEYNVVGQSRLSEPREIAQVRKENDDFLLAALGVIGPEKIFPT